MGDTAAMDTTSAIQNMWSIADKPERLRCFHKIVFELGLTDPQVFWDQFWAIWTTSENLNEDDDYITSLVEYGVGLGSPLLGLEDSEREALEAMPDFITVYRGCGSWNELGWSWTTDREKARWFAKRAFGPPERLVQRVTVHKKDVLAYLTGRNESEIVLNPQDLDYEEIETDEAFETENHKSSGLFYAIQSGKFDLGGDEGNRIRAQMMTNGIPFDAIEKNIAEISQMLNFARWAELSKRGFFEECIKALQARKLAGPEAQTSAFSL